MGPWGLRPGNETTEVHVHVYASSADCFQRIAYQTIQVVINRTYFTKQLLAPCLFCMFVCSSMRPHLHVSCVQYYVTRNYATTYIVY